MLSTHPFLAFPCLLAPLQLPSFLQWKWLNTNPILPLLLLKALRVSISSKGRGLKEPQVFTHCRLRASGASGLLWPRPPFWALLTDPATQVCFLFLKPAFLPPVSRFDLGMFLCQDPSPYPALTSCISSTPYRNQELHSWLFDGRLYPPANCELHVGGKADLFCQLLFLPLTHTEPRK